MTVACAYQVTLLAGYDDGVFGDFPKISDHFSKISEDSPKLVRRSNEQCRTFSRKFAKIAKECRGRPEDVLIINPRIYVQLQT